MLAHLDGFDLDKLPEPETNLTYLLFALISVSLAVECWKQLRVPDSGSGPRSVAALGLHL